MTPPGSDARLALATALLEQDEDGYVVLRAVRDESGALVDLVHEVVNDVSRLSAGRELLGRGLRQEYGEEATLYGAFCRLLQAGDELRTELRVTASSVVDPAIEGRTFQVYARGVGEFVVCQYRDITDLRAADEALRQDALQDSLTGLLNRRAFLKQLDHALDKLVRHAGLVAVLYCDVDGLKAVNDALGHAAGDALLRHVADRMRVALRPQDVVSRFGGDEFVVLCEDLRHPAEAVEIGRRIRREVTTTAPAGTASALGRPASVSVGVATTTDKVTAERLLAHADAALYEAKGRVDSDAVLFESPRPGARS